MEWSGYTSSLQIIDRIFEPAFTFHTGLMNFVKIFDLRKLFGENAQKAAGEYTGGLPVRRRWSALRTRPQGRDRRTGSAPQASFQC